MGSDVREQLRYMTLRASVAVKGRAVTLYEQAFEYKNYNSPKSHQYFLDKLQTLLPEGCTPLLSRMLDLEIHGFGKSPTKVGSGWEAYVAKSRSNVVMPLGNGTRPSILRQLTSRSF